jgi:hypothetical protein
MSSALSDEGSGLSFVIVLVSYNSHTYILTHIHIYIKANVCTCSSFMYVSGRRWAVAGQRARFLWVSSFGSVTRQRSNNGVMRSFVGSVPRQRPTGNSGVVFSLGSVLRGLCRGNIILLIQHELQRG